MSAKLCLFGSFIFLIGSVFLFVGIVPFILGLILLLEFGISIPLLLNPNNIILAIPGVLLSPLGLMIQRRALA